MSDMFNGCSGLTSLDLSGWNTINLSDIYGMFRYCTSLESLDLSGWNLTDVTHRGTMFSRCYSLRTIKMVGCNSTTVNIIKSELNEVGIQDQVTIIT